MKRCLLILIGVSCVAAGCTVSSVFADNLMQVYRQAVKRDPIFAQAESTWQSQKMNLPIARAGYLPQLSITGSAVREYQGSNFSLPGFGSTTFGGSNGSLNVGSGNTWWQYGYGITATQPIFNAVAWAQIKGASATVKAATATFLAAQQSLMQRTASAYFSVLQAYDQLRYTIADRKAVWQQYLTAREQFRVGLIAITDEYDAKSSYDQAVAQQIGAQNNLNIQLENLRVITNRAYGSLKGLRKLPVFTPKPNNINTWVDIAVKQNYSLNAQNFNVLVAMQQIKQQAAGGYPTLGLQAGLGESHAVDNPPSTATNTANIGLNLAYNPIQGGLVIASTRQARYEYVTASGLQEQTYRQVVDQTRTSFLSVLSNGSKIKADQQSIVSAQNAFNATKAGYRVGTRTMVDVLKALTTVYQTQQQYAIDEYAYINNLVALKAAAGTLSVTDLQEINMWLGKSIQFPEQTSVSKLPVEDKSAHPAVNGSDSDSEKDHKNTSGKKSAEKPNAVTEKNVTKTPEKPVEKAPVQTTPAPAQNTGAASVPLAPPKVTMLPQPAVT